MLTPRPERLTNAEYMPQSLALRMYHQTLYELCPLHWHEFYEMSIILAGEGTHILNGRTHALVPGSIFLLTPADFHEVGPTPGKHLELFNVIFSAEILKEEVYHLLFTQLREYATVCPPEQFLSLVADFRRLWMETQEVRMGRDILIVGTLERILIDLARICSRELGEIEGVAPVEQHTKLRNGLIYIHHHFREELSLEQVAQQVHLSPNYFSECFRKTYGAPFQGYLQALRLNFAMSLLSVAKLPITDICHASGFNTLSHFERAFKHKFGQSPREVMQEHRLRQVGIV